MAEKKKNLRETIRNLKVGESITVKREDFPPSSVRATVFFIKQDYNREFAVKIDKTVGCEVRREV